MIECITTQGEIHSVPIDTLKFRPSVYALIVHEGKLLLVVNRTTRQRTLPGGGIELGERVVDALRREVKEETGIDIDVGAFCGIEERFYYYDPLQEAYHGLLLFFRCTPRSLAFSNNSRVDDIEGDPEWVDIAGLKADSLVPGETVLELLGSFESDRAGLFKY